MNGITQCAVRVWNLNPNSDGDSTLISHFIKYDSKLFSTWLYLKGNFLNSIVVEVCSVFYFFIFKKRKNVVAYAAQQMALAYACLY